MSLSLDEDMEKSISSPKLFLGHHIQRQNATVVHGYFYFAESPERIAEVDRHPMEFMTMLEKDETAHRRNITIDRILISEEVQLPLTQERLTRSKTKVRTYVVKKPADVIMKVLLSGALVHIQSEIWDNFHTLAEEDKIHITDQTYLDAYRAFIKQESQPLKKGQVSLPIILPQVSLQTIAPEKRSVPTTTTTTTTTKEESAHIPDTLIDLLFSHEPSISLKQRPRQKQPQMTKIYESEPITFVLEKPHKTRQSYHTISFGSTLTETMLRILTFNSENLDVAQ
jgi:hypothetical protein